VQYAGTPALGDIDGDGLPEIVSVTSAGFLVAFEHDGALKWTSPTSWPGGYISSLALADLDNDTDVEIVGSDRVFDHLGGLVFAAPQGAPHVRGDGGGRPRRRRRPRGGDRPRGGPPRRDGPLPQPGGHARVPADRQPRRRPAAGGADHQPGGITLLEHDGTIKYQDLRPTGDPQGGLTWHRPATVQDFDGDDISDFAVSSANNYATYKRGRDDPVAGGGLGPVGHRGGHGVRLPRRRDRRGDVRRRDEHVRLTATAGRCCCRRRAPA
jgi:hypothetical protein